jgi:hypothetical protein
MGASLSTGRSILALAILVAGAACEKKSDEPPPGEEVSAGGGVVGAGNGVSSRSISAAPTNLVLSDITDTSITVGWTDISTNELIFDVELCAGTDCTSFSPASRSPLAADSTSHTESSLTPATFYRFRIRSTNRNGSSAWITSEPVTTMLAPDSDLTLSAATTSALTIGWTPSPSDHTGTEIERCQGSGCTDFRPVFGSPFESITSHVEPGLEPGTIYRLRVRSLSASTTAAWLLSDDLTTEAEAEAPQTAAPSPAPEPAPAPAPDPAAPAPPSPPASPALPAAPTSLTVASLSDTEVTLTWTDNATTELLYDLVRCEGASCTSFSRPSGSPMAPDTTSFVASGLTPSTIYTFRVRVTDANGNSDWLTSDPITTAPAAPTAFTTGTVTASSIALSWTDNASDETAYEVQRCAGAGCSSFAAVSASPLAAGSSSHTESSLTGATTYRFRARAARSSAKSAWLTSGDITTLVAAASCSTPTTSVVDKGSKGTTTAVGRGLWSDTKVIPGTRQPAVAYYDGSATGGTASIKLAWWNGSSFVVESVAGDARVAAGSATFVRLAFLSNGKPMVFWTTGGTTVKGAMRSAALSASGTWSAAVLDTVTGAATRALEVSVSPLDQVGLIYLTNTTTAGRARFVYCDSSCASLSSFVAMSAESDTVEAANVTAAFMGAGVAWCKHDSTTYYPAVTYPGNGGSNIRYSSCLGALSTCRTATGWSGQTTNVVASAGVIAKLYIDPTVVGDQPKILTRNSANTLLQAFQLNQACNAAAPYSVTAGNTFGAATSGTAWASLLKSSYGTWHVAANLGATNVHYHNSVTSTFSTTTWNAAAAVDTLTLPAAGAGGGGAAVNNTDGQIYISYGGAAAPFNLMLGVVGDLTVASNAASAFFYSHLPDLSGGMHLPLSTGQTRNVAVASTSDSRPGVAYIDGSIGAAAGSLLKYAFRDGASSSVAWTKYVIPNTTTPAFPSLAFDHDDKPWISYYDAGTFRYFLVTNSETDGSGTWSSYQFPISAKTASAVAPATDDTAITMSYSGGVAKPLMIVMNSTAAGGTGVRAALFNPSVNAFTTYATLDSLGASYGTRLTADFDTSGNIVVAYYDLTTTKVRFSFSTNGQTWTGSAPQISAATTGREGLSIRLNPSTGRPGISYYDRANNIVYYTTCSTALASCASASNWSTETVASNVGVSGIVTGNEQVLNTSLTYSEEGDASITYLLGASASAQSLVTADNAGGSFVASTLASAAESAVSGAATLNFGMTGLSASSTRTADGSLVTAHVGPNNWLYATTCGD